MEHRIRRGLLGCPVQSFWPLGSLTNSRQTLRSLWTYRPPGTGLDIVHGASHSWSPLVMKQDDQRASPPSRTRPSSGDSREPPLLGPLQAGLCSATQPRAKASICFMTQVLMQLNKNPESILPVCHGSRATLLLAATLLILWETLGPSPNFRAYPLRGAVESARWEG